MRDEMNRCLKKLKKKYSVPQSRLPPLLDDDETERNRNSIGK